MENEEYSKLLKYAKYYTNCIDYITKFILGIDYFEIAIKQNDWHLAKIHIGEIEESISKLEECITKKYLFMDFLKTLIKEINENVDKKDKNKLLYGIDLLYDYLRDIMPAIQEACREKVEAIRTMALMEKHK